MGTRIAGAGGIEPDELRLAGLTKSALRAGFASWASDHAGSSVLRAHSAWSSFFDHLVAEDLAEGNPMAAVRKPKARRDQAKMVRAADVTARLLAAAAVPDPRAQRSWPERDLALVATFFGAQKFTGALVHALRHTFTTQALETGADVVEVQEILGHASLATTRRYLETTGSQLRATSSRRIRAQIALREFTRQR